MASEVEKKGHPAPLQERALLPKVSVVPAAVAGPDGGPCWPCSRARDARPGPPDPGLSAEGLSRNALLPLRDPWNAMSPWPRERHGGGVPDGALMGAAATAA